MDDENPQPDSDERIARTRQTGKRLPMHPDLAKAMIEQRARDDAVEFVAIIKAKRELEDMTQAGAVPPDGGHAFIKRRSKELAEEIRSRRAAKAELADSEHE